MKLWYSFTKELKLSSKSWYFYIEFGLALVLLVILLFVVPEEFDSRKTEYIYIDMPQAYEEAYMDKVLEHDPDGKYENVEIEIDDSIEKAKLVTTDNSKVYFVESREVAYKYADLEREFSAIISLNDNNEIVYEYFLQGYENERLKNLYYIFHNQKITLDETDVYMKSIDDEKLYDDYQVLSDREFMVPMFLVYNGSLMGMFIIAAYIFMDKHEGIIKAYAVTASHVWEYLLSKVAVVTLTSIVTSLILTVPVMGWGPNYPMLILFVAVSGFFATSIGLVISSYYKDIMESFGALFIAILLIMMPSVGYFIPSWNPVWMPYMPAYHFVQSFKEIIVANGDMAYVSMATAGFGILGILVFLFANYRFKKTLSI